MAGRRRLVPPGKSRAWITATNQGLGRSDDTPEPPADWAAADPFDQARTSDDGLF